MRRCGRINSKSSADSADKKPLGERGTESMVVSLEEYDRSRDASLCAVRRIGPRLTRRMARRYVSQPRHRMLRDPYVRYHAYTAANASRFRQGGIDKLVS